MGGSLAGGPLAEGPLAGGPLAGRLFMDLSSFNRRPGYLDTMLGSAHTSPGDPHDPETGPGRLPRKLGTFSGSKVLRRYMSSPGAPETD